MPDYTFIRRRGVTFMFKADPADVSVLHIYARHLKRPADAIRVWFSGVHTYNADHDRFEAELEGIGIYWFWRRQAEDHVMIISCFDVREGKG